MLSLHRQQQKILDLLLETSSGVTIDRLVDSLQLSKTAVKLHLQKIEQLGLIKYEDSKGSVGRPRRNYFLTHEGQEAFPKQYSWLATGLLEVITENLGREKTSRFMTQLADRVAQSVEPQLKLAKNSADRLKQVSKIMNELGYKSTIRQSDVRRGAILEATNCVYHSIAKQHPDLCRFDIRLLEQTTGGLDVKLESCIARGDSICRFCIKKV